MLRTARLKMHGEIKVTKWMPFHADQVLSPDGFVWSARAGRFPMRISGFEWDSAGGDDRHATAADEVCHARSRRHRILRQLDR